MPEPRYAGVDPGQTGSCIVVAADGATVLAHQRWKKALVPPPLEVLDGVVLLAVEAQYVSGPHASLVLAEWCGRLLAALPDGISVERPLASSWRAKVFRCGRVRREPAKDLAVAAATPYLLAGGVERPTVDDCEAWCIARWAAHWAAFLASDAARMSDAEVAGAR